MVNSVEEALEEARNRSIDQVFILGGAEIYKLTLPIADELILTHIHGDFDGDTYFPEINYEDFEITEEIPNESNENNPYPFTFTFYKRK